MTNKQNSAIVYAPYKLSRTELAKLEKYLTDQKHLSLKLTPKIDKSLLAGFKIVYKDLEINYSLKDQLQNLNQQFSL